MRRAKRLFRALLGAALLGDSTNAAASPVEPIHLRYEGSPKCGTLDELWTRVRARTSRARPAARDEVGRLFIVRVDLGARTTRGRLKILSDAGASSVREIETSGCDEALDGLSLIVALAIDPASAVLGRGDHDAAVDDRRAGPSAASPGDHAATGGTRPALENARSESAEEGRTAAGGIDNARTRSHSWRLAAAAHAVTGIAPAILWGARLGLERAAQGDGWYLPAWRLSVAYASHAAYPIEVGNANFRYGQFGLEFCPLRTPAGPVRARACIMADVGIVYAWGSEAPHPHSTVRFWADLGPELRFEWSLAPSWQLELGTGLVFPLRRDRFLIGPHQFHEVPAFSLAAAAGVSMRLP